MGLETDLWDREEAESSSPDCRPLPISHIYTLFLTAGGSSLESGNLPFAPRKSSPGPRAPGSESSEPGSGYLQLLD